GTVKAERGGPDGKLVPLATGGNDAARAFAATSAEVRIPLEWLGGYARTAALGLSVEAKGGASLKRWPDAAAPAFPASFGALELGPVYAQGTSAGSAFLDGREGYLVVPYAPELNPQELTIEAWVRAVDGDCGTLVGNGQASSYWLGLCDGIRF